MIVEIENAFNSVFPVYKNKDPPKAFNSNYLGCLNLQEKYLIEFGMCQANKHVQEKSQNTKVKKFSDKEIKDLYMKELFSHLKQMMSEKYDKIKTDEETTKNFQSTIGGDTENMKNILNDRGLFLKQVDSSIFQLKEEVNNLKDTLANETNNINFENIGDIVELSNEKVIKLVSVEANIEELLLIVKKAYEKQAIELEETIKFIRSLSRESFKVKTYREKLLKSR